ncbi:MULTISPECIES: MFS transporter [unclassified Nocardiopsis]|uniref:MFS transporter n=1 Tax=unclassified Nocardiopsis TaxID=2649073 RepID=UPI00135BDFB8|nr:MULTISPECIES: MFS transporter [unclassified Nocardiopsis]
MDTAPPAVPPSRERLGSAFARFWAAGTLTNLGDGTLATALPLIAATLTSDPLAVSGLAAARFLPWLLVAPLAGVLLDRVDRLRAMAVANAVAATAVGVLTVVILTGHASLWSLYATLFAVVCCETVSDPASRIGVVRLVPARLLDRANGRAEAGRLVAQDFAARPVAGVLFAVAAVLPVAGAALSYALCAVLVAVVVALLRRRPPGAAVPEPDPGAEPRAGVLRSLREGFGYVFGDPLLGRLALVNAATMAGVQTGTAVLVLHVQHVLGVPPALFGLFLASSAVGGLLGAVCASRLMARTGRAAMTTGGYTGLGLCLVLVGVLPNAYLGALLWAVLGLCVAASNIAAAPLLQTVVPDRLRGRASAAFRTVGWGAAPLGALLGGLLGRIDLALPFVAGGLLVTCTALLLRRAVAEGARLCDRVPASPR